jgi:osmoprotectant transport system substrate-binding protein
MKRIKILGLILITGLLLSTVAGCGGSSPTASSGRDGTLTIGSKNFTENIIMAEIMAQTVEANTSLKVERKLNLGGTLICWEGLKKGELDMYPDYTGTGLMAILKKEVITDPDEVYNIVQQEYNKQFKIKWLKPVGFNNTYATAVTKEFAKKHALNTTSDLKAHAGDLVFCAEQEFFNRNDGFQGFCQAYGLKFKDTKGMDIGLKYKAVADGKVDVIDAFSTDGELVSYKMKVLEDDKKFFPPYYCAPIVRMDTLEKHPELEEALNKLAGKISDEDMQQMNYKVKEKGLNPADVAAEFLKAKGIVK